MADLKYIEIDTATLYNNAVQNMEIAAGEPLYPGDERRTMTEGLILILQSITNKVNAAINDTLLSNATGEALDAMGVRVGVDRIAETGATATFKFTLEEARTLDTTIPEGTLITTDGDIDFATDEDLVIFAGGLTGYVTATCTTGGEDGNGFPEGAVAQLVEGIPGVLEAQNIEVTAGGADEESDSALRERIKLAPSAFSTAGSRKSYIYWGKSVSASIADILVDVPEACEILLYVMCTNGALPNEALLRKVEEACSEDTRRPLCDRVTALAPEPVYYDIALTYYSTEDEAEDCHDTIEQAVNIYKNWQAECIGRHINPDKLKSLCLSPEEGTGCIRVDIASPTLTAIGNRQVAIVENITITGKIIEKDHAANEGVVV